MKVHVHKPVEPDLAVLITLCASGSFSLISSAEVYLASQSFVWSIVTFFISFGASFWLMTYLFRKHLVLSTNKVHIHGAKVILNIKYNIHDLGLKWHTIMNYSFMAVLVVGSILHFAVGLVGGGLILLAMLFVGVASFYIFDYQFKITCSYTDKGIILSTFWGSVMHPWSHIGGYAFNGPYVYLFMKDYDLNLKIPLFDKEDKIRKILKSYSK
jgi:hypothetical protein